MQGVFTAFTLEIFKAGNEELRNNRKHLCYLNIKLPTHLLRKCITPVEKKCFICSFYFTFKYIPFIVILLFIYIRNETELIYVLQMYFIIGIFYELLPN